MNDASILIVGESESGQRLDTYLAGKLESVSRAQIQRAIENGDVTINDSQSKSSYRIRAADEIQFEITPAAPLEAVAEEIPLEIVFEDEDVIVINKPAGMVVHPGAGITSGTLANALVYYFGQIAPPGSGLRPGIVHRIDVGTSGLVVVAKTDHALHNLSEQFAERRVKKIYLALVFGNVAGEKGEIDQPIGRDPHNRVKMSVRPAGSGRAASTLFGVRERFVEFTLLDVEIRTGRTHQIRVHLAHLRHPVVGDTGYDGGRGKSFTDSRLRAEISRLGRPFLHARVLGFTHPKSGAPMSFEAPLPSELDGFLERLRERKEC